MKKFRRILLLTLIANAFILNAQVDHSPNRIFDTIYDQYGVKYTLNDLVVDTVTLNNDGQRTRSLCSNNTGYFQLYFEPGCGMENTGDASHNARRNVICQLFYDISQFIYSPLTTTGKKVNIWIRKPSVLSTGLNAGAMTFYSAPNITGYSGILDGEVWKTIHTGQDSYSGTTAALATTYGGGFFHAIAAFNFTSTPFHDDLLTAPPTGTLDLYSVGLHEVCHALGIGSQIYLDGTSKMAIGQYYTRFDQQLKTQANTPLITNTGTCSLYGYSWNSSLTATNVVTPNPSSCISNSTTCSNAVWYASSTQTVPVYTPNCFENASTLSHFEDLCISPPNQGNDAYFVVCNSLPFGTPRRWLKPEERQVLCDIGYSVNTVYGSSTYTTTQHNYGGSNCAGINVGGVNDGLTSVGAYSFVTNVGVATTTIYPNANDYNASSWECLQTVIGSGTLSATSGISSAGFTYTPAASGVHVLRYVPVNSSSEKGNITYIYVYVPASTSCTLTSTCEMVLNRGFESPGTSCGNYGGSPSPTIDCWKRVPNGSATIFLRTCSFGVPVTGYNGGAFDSWNGSPNNTILRSDGLYEGNLSTALTPSSQYQVSYWAASSTPTINSSYNQSYVGIAVSPTPVALTGFIVNTPPATYTALTNQTLPADPYWHYYSTLITYTGSASAANLGVISYSGTNTFFDDISIIPASAACSFSLASQACLGYTTNLNSLVSVPNGTFTGSGVSLSGGNYIYNSSVSGAGLQTIAYTYTTASGCTLTTYGQINIFGPLTVTATSSPSYIVCPGTSVTLSASIAPPPSIYSFTWNPGSISGQTCAVTPTTTTVYTVSVRDPLSCYTSTTSIGVETGSPTLAVSLPSQTICPSNSATLSVTYAQGVSSLTWSPGGSNASTITVTPSSTTIYTVAVQSGSCISTANATVNTGGCCTATNVITSLTTGSYGGSNAINVPITIASGNNVILTGGEFLICPNINLTVASGATLTLSRAHLYSCSSMWGGIIVDPGGRLITESDALVEDAITAVSVNNHTATATIFSITATTFNKNRTAISVTNYTETASTYPFILTNCIFTSRTLTFTPGTWPGVAFLKTTCTPAHTLGTPYCLQGTTFTVTNLKAPYDDATAKYGVRLNNVGATINPTTTPTYYSIQLGDPASTTNINIFDNLYWGVDAVDANLKFYQNVVQNSQYSGHISYGFTGGYGLSVQSSSVANTYLNFKAPAPYTTIRKNKFYDCVYAIYSENVHEMNTEYIEIRSTKTSSGIYQKGKHGIWALSNRFKKYDLSNDLIYNIDNGITFFADHGPAVFGASTYSGFQYAGQVNVNTNTIKPLPSGSISGEFVTEAIHVENLLGSGSSQTVVSGSTIKCSANAIDAFAGITATGITDPKIDLSSNTINIKDDNSLGDYGVFVASCNGGTVATNNVVGTNTTNASIQGIHTTLTTTLAVTCNTTSTSYIGFEFDSSQPNMIWKGNSMTSHVNGMLLNYTATIGQQGSSGNPIDNKWNGTWTGSIYTTYTDNDSQASNSPIYTRSATPYYPSNNNANPSPYRYLLGTNHFTTTGSYACSGGGGGGGSFAQGGGEEGLTEEEKTYQFFEATAGSDVNTKDGFDPNAFIAQNQLFQIIERDPSLVNSSDIISAFYNTNKTKSYGTIQAIEIELGKGNLELASALVQSLTTANPIENNYKEFYQYYINYQKGLLSNTDKTRLDILASKCPFTDGEVVYKARGLYNVANKVMKKWLDVCSDESSVNSKLTSNSALNSAALHSVWDVNIYPNPTKGEIFLNSSKESENLHILILDVSGRVIVETTLLTKGHLGNLKLDVKEGVYFVTLTNSDNERIIKKVVVTK